MTTGGLILVCFYFVVPLALGFALPMRLRLVFAVGGALAVANWVWRVFIRPPDADIEPAARAVLALLATVGLVVGCSALVLCGATARRRIARNRSS